MRIGLNVGSGQRRFESSGDVEWVNVDKVEREGMRVDRLDDGRDLCTADAAVDFVVLHHVLEHFWLGDAVALVAEAHRVLKPGGSLLVFVPNMQALAGRWLSGELDTQLYLTNVYGAYMGSPEDLHRWGFTWPTLDEFLSTHAKWSEVKAFDWRELPGSSFARDWWIIALECIK